MVILELDVDVFYFISTSMRSDTLVIRSIHLFVCTDMFKMRLPEVKSIAGLEPGDSGIPEID